MGHPETYFGHGQPLNGQLTAKARLTESKLHTYFCTAKNPHHTAGWIYKDPQGLYHMENENLIGDPETYRRLKPGTLDCRLGYYALMCYGKIPTQFEPHESGAKRAILPKEAIG